MSEPNLDLVFDGKAYGVPKKRLFELVTHHLDLIDAKSYEVQSSVPVSVFGQFVSSLASEKKPAVTQDNAASLLLLAKEFFLSDLASECAAFAADPLSLLSARVSKLEQQVLYLCQGKVEE
jgi:hypothetical protein